MTNSSAVKRLSLEFSRFRFPLKLAVTTLLSIAFVALLMWMLPDMRSLAAVAIVFVLFLGTCFLLRSVLRHISLWMAVIGVIGLAAFISYLVYANQYLLFSAQIQNLADNTGMFRALLLAFTLCAVPVALCYQLYKGALSRVEQQARSTDVKDLDLRIRPHFLFNSLNSVAGLIHADPDRAEEGLMDLADMFRIIMTDKRQSVPLSAELDMARKYVSLEKIRLGDRLKVVWELRHVDKSIPLPILTMQPLIENAIYHGIETRMRGGVIAIKARSNDDFIFISIINPVPETAHSVRKGNQIAQKNLKNRIKYAYDGKASINVMQTENYYTVTLKLPRTLEEG